MASASLIPLISYSDSCWSFQLTKGRSLIGYGIGKLSPFPDSSLLSPQQQNHTRRLTVTHQQTVICASFSKSAEVTSKSWDKLVLKNESTVVVEFYASWCGPCQMVHRVIDDIANEYRGKLKRFVVNTDHDMVLADEYDIKAVPVVLLFKNGKKHDCIAGTMPKEYYVAAIEKVLAA